MKYFNFLVISLFIFFITLFFNAPSAYAVAYDLIAPTDTLTRGQNVQFIVNIDTQGTSVTEQTIGMTFDTQYLQYVSTTPGDAMTAVSVTPGSGQLLLNGSNSTGFNGQGAFAYVTFKLIAQAAGSTELCALFQPSGTPAPTTAPTAPVPTELPKTGNEANTLPVGILGGVLILGSAGTYLALQKRFTK
jgi:LPXTG-motif cell wall-anchored protein